MPRIAPLRKMFSRPVSSGWKSGADLEHARDAAAKHDAPFGRLGDAAGNLEHGALAGTVAADNADDIALLDLEADFRSAQNSSTSSP